MPKLVRCEVLSHDIYTFQSVIQTISWLGTTITSQLPGEVTRSQVLRSLDLHKYSLGDSAKSTLAAM